MSNSMVLDLQADALNSQLKVSDIARKAYFVARKLGVTELEQWLHYEINGYPSDDMVDIPEYRHVIGSLQGWNSVRGWIPIIIQNREWHDAICNRCMINSLASIDDMIENDGDTFSIAVGPENSAQLSRMVGRTTKFQIVYNIVHLVSVRECVRNMILDWALKLESEGIEGVNMKFSDEEKGKANEIKYTINNNFNGDVINSQIQQNTTSSIQTLQYGLDVDKIKFIVDSVKNNIDSFGLSDNDNEILSTSIQGIEEELDNDDVNTTVIKSFLTGAKNVLEGIGTNLIASGIIHLISDLLTK